MPTGDWLVLGASGQLGRELMACELPMGVRLLPATRSDLDLAEPAAIPGFIAQSRPELVINAAAWTDVDGAESLEADARLVNAEAVGVLASACREHSAHLVHVSTDYVFGLQRATREPWGETDEVNPQGVYARTKAAGEALVRSNLPQASAVVRTAWLYSGHGRNFVRTMLAKARSREQVSVVDDQWGQPTWAHDVAEHVLDLGARLLDGRAPAGTYHATNSGMATWFEFARAIYALAGADENLVAAVTSETLDRPAPRPSWSVLGHEGWGAAGLQPLRPWREALEAALPTIDA